MRSAPTPPARTSPTLTAPPSRPTTASSSSATSAPTTSTVFTINPDTGQLSDPRLFTNDRPGSGPRHVAFHPNGRWVYGINEIDSTIDHYLWTATRFSDTPQGLLVNTNTPVKTIAPDFPADKNTAAELAISPDGNFLYASNRGEDYTGCLLRSAQRRQARPSSSASPAAARPLATSPSTPPPSGSSAATRTRQRSPSSSAIPRPENSLAPPRPLRSTHPSTPSSSSCPLSRSQRDSSYQTT